MTIQIKRNEQYNSLSVNINKKDLCELNNKTGQMVYHKHTVHVLTELKTKTKQGKFGQEVFGWFKGTLDNGTDEITFFFGNTEVKTLDKLKVEVGNKLEISGGFYTDKKGQLKTCVNIIKLSKPVKQKVLHPFIIDWNNHFAQGDNDSENTMENFVDTFSDQGLTDLELRNLYRDQVILK